MASDYTPERVGDRTTATGEKIRVILKTMKKPETILPFKVRDHDGKVLCTILGEAYVRKQGVL
jgi:hypothetical protein